MKFAVIKTSGTQLKVSEGETIKLPKLSGKPKSKLNFNEVLLIVDGKKVLIGQPLVKGARVTAEIVEQTRDKKIRVARFKAKSKYRKVKGHKTHLTIVKVNKIETTAKKT